MELLAFILLWPFLILAVGLTVIAFGDWGGGSFLGGWLLWPIGIFLFFFLLAKMREKGTDSAHQLATLRHWMIAFSISILLPTLARYAVESFNNSLAAVVVALVFGFGLVVAGIFMQNRPTLMYSNIIGGALTLLYTYSQLWDLGELARIIVAAVALVLAVGISVVKLKDKLS